MWTLLSLVIGFFISLLDAYVFSRLWAWFVVPQFHVATMSVAVAFGCSSAYFLLRKMDIMKEYREQQRDGREKQQDDDESKKAITNRYTFSIATTLLVWGYSALVHFCF